MEKSSPEIYEFQFPSNSKKGIPDFTISIDKEGLYLCINGNVNFLALADFLEFLGKKIGSYRIEEI